MQPSNAKIRVILLCHFLWDGRQSPFSNLLAKNHIYHSSNNTMLRLDTFKDSIHCARIDPCCFSDEHDNKCSCVHPSGCQSLSLSVCVCVVTISRHAPTKWPDIRGWGNGTKCMKGGFGVTRVATRQYPSVGHNAQWPYWLSSSRLTHEMLYRHHVANIRVTLFLWKYLSFVFLFGFSFARVEFLWRSYCRKRVTQW